MTSEITTTTKTIKSFHGVREHTTLTITNFAHICGHTSTFIIEGAVVASLWDIAAKAEYQPCDTCRAKARRRRKAA